MPSFAVLQGNWLEVAGQLPDKTIQVCVTSPPYWSLRDYKIPPSVWGGDIECCHDWGHEIVATPREHQEDGHWQHEYEDILNGVEVRPDPAKPVPVSQGRFCLKCNAWLGQLGLEPAPRLFVDHLVLYFREVWRVLRDDGTLWVNIGDTFITSAGLCRTTGGDLNRQEMLPKAPPNRMRLDGFKPKDLAGIPWRMAFALQDDGWYLRSEMIWRKSSPMPESPRDRPSRDHEHIFLFAKRRRYYFDQVAIAEPTVDNERSQRLRRQVIREEENSVNVGRDDARASLKPQGEGGAVRSKEARKQLALKGTKNRRTVIDIAPTPFAGAHFATFPVELPTLAILAGSSEAGACVKCGKGWHRVVDKRFYEQTDVSIEKARRGNGDTKGMDSSSRWQGTARGTVERMTKGWTVSCRCFPAVSVAKPEDSRLLGLTRPCIVLDVCGGAFTTALAAARNGRDSVMVEAGAEYIDLGEGRVIRDAPMFFGRSTIEELCRCSNS